MARARSPNHNGKPYDAAEMSYVVATDRGRESTQSGATTNNGPVTYYDNVVELIGNTPLVRLRSVTTGQLLRVTTSTFGL